MNMHKVLKKYSSVLLLLGMVAYCGILILIFHSPSGTRGVFQSSNLKDSVYSMTKLEYRPLDSMEVKEVEEVTEVSQVLGASSGGRCHAVLEIGEPQLFCAAERINMEIESESISVKEGAEIKFIEIYAPSALYTGAVAPFDNLVQINNPEGRVAFRNANEMINPQFDYLVKKPPLKELIVGGVNMEDGNTSGDLETFKMHGVPSGDAEGITEFVFDVDLENDKSVCPDVVNDGRFNVMKSNDVAKDLVDSITPPGLMAFQDTGYKRDNQEFCQEVSPKNVFDLSKEQSFLLCKESFVTQIWDLIKGVSIFDEFRKSVDVQGVLIDAPFGSADTCNNETCAIRYFEAGRLLTTPPTYMDSLYPAFVSDEKRGDDYVVADPIFLTTPCRISVDGKPHDTKCYWDLSAWQHIFKIEEIFTYPGFEKKYSESQYWNAVEQELKYLGSRATFSGEIGDPGGTLLEYNEQAWAEHLRSEVRASGLMSLNPSDAHMFFPDGVVTEEGWIRLLTAMSYLESGHRPDLQYEEDASIWDNTTNAPALSTGLFQMSQGSIRGYKFPGYENVTTEQLKDPNTSITIAVKLLENWVKKDGCISCQGAGGAWRGGARYWAVLREGRGVATIRGAVLGY